MTDTGIQLNDLYLIRYYGFVVVFQVCWTSEDSVRLIELAVKRYKDGYTLTKKYRPSRFPLVVTGRNVYSKSTYEVEAIREDKKLPIRIGHNTKLFWKAINILGEQVLPGTVLAVPFLNHRERYWKEPIINDEYNVIA